MLNKFTYYAKSRLSWLGFSFFGYALGLYEHKMMYNINAMFALLKELNTKAEELKGRKLIYTLLVTFVCFSLIGFATNYLIRQILNNGEMAIEDSLADVETPPVEMVTMEGIITFTDPKFYEQDGISYYLADKVGKELILLKATDQKLQVAEGLFATIYGQKAKTQDGKKELLIVEKIMISQN